LLILLSHQLLITTTCYIQSVILLTGEFNVIRQLSLLTFNSYHTMPPKAGEKALKGWSPEEEVSFLHNAYYLAANSTQLELVTRLLFHIVPSPPLTKFTFGDRSTSALRNKILSLAKKYKIEPEKPEEDTETAPKKKAAPKKRKNAAISEEESKLKKSRSVEVTSDEDAKV
jgi:hypothetical protein